MVLMCFFPTVPFWCFRIFGVAMAACKAFNPNCSSNDPCDIPFDILWGIPCSLDLIHMRSRPCQARGVAFNFAVIAPFFVSIQQYGGWATPRSMIGKGWWKRCWYGMQRNGDTERGSLLQYGRKSKGVSGADWVVFEFQGGGIGSLTVEFQSPKVKFGT